MAYQDFFELEVWKLARRFKKVAVQCISRFPPSEQYDLRSQLLRAARSIQANIAEGHGRQTSKDEARFLVIARGSLAECLNHLIEALDMGYISDDELRELKSLYDETGKTLNGYLRYVKSKIPLPRSEGETDSNIHESDGAYSSYDITSDADLIEHLNQNDND